MLQNNLRKMNKGLLALMAIILVFTMVMTGCGKKEEVLVTYKDGGKVTRPEFDKYISMNLLLVKQYAQFKDDPAFQQEMMKQLVTTKILNARADDKAKAEADKQAKTQYEQIKTMLSAQEGGLDKQLKDANLTEKDVQDLVKNNILAIVSMENKVTDQEIQDAYNKKLQQDPHVYDVATVSHILIGITDPATGKESRSKEDALKRAKEVQGKLSAGGDFAALAKEYSDDPGSKDNGGKYENVEISQWVPEFKKAAAELPIGKISDPVETSFGYHIMKVEARSSKTFDDVKPGIRSELAETKIYEFVEKELPTLIEQNNLPKPEEKKPAGAPATQTPKPEGSK